METKKIKIMFIIDNLFPGGTENQLVLLVNNLPQNEFDTIILALDQCSYDFRLKNHTRLIKLSSNYPKFIKNIIKIVRIVKIINKENVGIIQTQFPSSEIYGTIAAKLAKKRPLLLATRRNFYHWIKEQPITFKITKKTAKLADYLLINSINVAKNCIQKENIEVDKIKVINNAVDLAKFNGNTAFSNKSRIGKKKEFVIGVVGNWRPVKGNELFLKAAELVMKKVNQATFVLAGYGPQEMELKRLSERLNISDRTKFIQKPGNIPEIIKTFDIAVQPSLSEAFSNVILEYMASGKPIVATKVGDNDLVIEHMRSGLIVEPNNIKELANSITYLCENYDKALEMGKRSLERVRQKWSPSIIFGQYRKFYKSIIKS